MSTFNGSVRLRGWLSPAVILVFAVLAAGTVAGGQEAKKEVFNATALSTGGPRTSPVASRLVLAIERWSSADDTQRLAAAVKGGPQQLLSNLIKLKVVGTISSPGSIGSPLYYAAQDTLPNGSRRIVLITDRPMSFAELWSQPITMDYPITYIELTVDKEGKGNGKMLVATKLIPTRNMIVVEDWAVDPVQLSDVRRQN